MDYNLALEAIKELLKKISINSLIVSLVFAFIVFLYTPDDNFIYEKLGKELFILFVALLCLCVLKLFKFIFSTIIENLNTKTVTKRAEENFYRELWKYIDSLSCEDRRLVYQFLQNNNKPFVTSQRSVDAASYHNKNALLSNGKAVVRTEYPYDKIDLEKFSCDTLTKITFVQFPNTRQELCMFKLTEDFYDALKKSQEKYGKISNFEEESSHE